MKSIGTVMVYADHDSCDAMPDLSALSFVERLVLLDNRMSLELKIYCSSCINFRINFHSFAYHCNLGHAGWKTGQCDEYRRR